jgi:hypothetical protein
MIVQPTHLEMRNKPIITQAEAQDNINLVPVNTNLMVIIELSDTYLSARMPFHYNRLFTATIMKPWMRVTVPRISDRRHP